jgi:hypothetical protein
LNEANFTPNQLIQVAQTGGWVPNSYNVSSPDVYNSGLGFENGQVTNWDGIQGYDKNRSYRWNVERDGLIPIVFNTAHRDLYEKAMDDIELNIGMKLFNRGVQPDGSQTVDSLMVNKQSVVLLTDSPSLNTTCSNGSNEWMDETFSINPPTHPAFWSKYPRQPLYFVMESVAFENASCNIYNATHHALAQLLGFRNFFYGFGDSNENPVMYMNLLKILYRNPVGTPFADLK